jgi:hypothetical protein
MNDSVATTNDYAATIVRMLTGGAEADRDALTRLDWEGVGAVLGLYRATEGRERTAVIEALGQIIEDEAREPWIVAQVIDLVSSLDLTQVEPSLDRLARRPVAQAEPLRGALDNYGIYRRLKGSARRPSAEVVGSRAVATG